LSSAVVHEIRVRVPAERGACCIDHRSVYPTKDPWQEDQSL
jgi:hypothetical protein